jgi:hypothetical protein
MIYKLSTLLLSTAISFSVFAAEELAPATPQAPRIRYQAPASAIHAGAASAAAAPYAGAAAAATYRSAEHYNQQRRFAVTPIGRAINVEFYEARNNAGFHLITGSPLPSPTPNTADTATPFSSARPVSDEGSLTNENYPTMPKLFG